MLRTSLAALVLVLFSGCDRIAAFAQVNPMQTFEARCEALRHGGAEIGRLPAALREDYSRSFSDLERMSDASNPNHRTVGLTRAKFGYRSSLELEGLEDAKGGRACAKPLVRVDIELSGMTVYVAREYRGDACREPLILEHERKHVAVFERYAAEIAPTLERDLEARFGNRVMVGASMAAIQQTVKRDLGVYLDAFMERARAEIDRRHAQIDTPDEYEKIARLCGRG
jgi:hypothetical protein